MSSARGHKGHRYIEAQLCYHCQCVFIVRCKQNAREIMQCHTAEEQTGQRGPSTCCWINPTVEAARGNPTAGLTPRIDYTHTHTGTHTHMYTQVGIICNGSQGEESAGISFRDDLLPAYGVENLPEIRHLLQLQSSHLKHPQARYEVQMKARLPLPKTADKSAAQ